MTWILVGTVAAVPIGILIGIAISCFGESPVDSSS